MLKILGLIFLFIYVIRPLFKLLFKGYIISQVHRQAAERQYREKEKRRKEGSIEVDYAPPKKGKNSKGGSDDYIPFEEIKDN